MDKFFSGNALKEMIDNKIHELNPLIKHGVSIEELKERISKKEEEKLFFNFKEKIENNINNNKFSIIAEMKKKSPSAGIIVTNYNPQKIAKIYNDNKATCLSVLTDKDYFSGYISHIKDIKEEGIKLPILCKDFFVHKWQLYAAKSFGADAILIILAGIEETLANELYEEALKLSLSVIIEVHTIEEAEYALRFKDALIGINNRNLKTLKTDIQTTYEINNALRDYSGPLICESGINSKEMLLEIERKTKIKTFLIGESLLKNLDKNSIFSVL
jgi:indole-3-glycerol phosphate synthase